MATVSAAPSAAVVTTRRSIGGIRTDILLFYAAAAGRRNRWPGRPAPGGHGALPGKSPEAGPPVDGTGRELHGGAAPTMRPTLLAPVALAAAATFAPALARADVDVSLRAGAGSVDLAASS